MKKMLIPMMLFVGHVQAQFPAVLDLNQQNGLNGFALNGVNQWDQVGSSVQSAGDVNDDGLTDLLVGAEGVGSDGKVYLIFGSQSAYSTSYSINEVSGDLGIEISPPAGGSSIQFGYAVSGLGDVNGDEVDDFIISSPGYDQGSALNIGRSFVVFGDPQGYPDGIDLSLLDGSNGFTITGRLSQDFSFTGTVVTSIGDINADGINDLAIGARSSDISGISSGVVYVLFGTNGGFPANIDLGDLTALDGFVVIPERDSMGVGRTVSGLGDVNGDGFDDMAIGTSFTHDDEPGYAYVLYGSDQGFSQAVLLAFLDSASGFKIHGTQLIEFEHTLLSSAGDFNHDGINDIMITSAISFESDKFMGVIYGRTDDFPGNFHVTDLNGDNGFQILNPQFSLFEIMLGGYVGDINHDGTDDLWISSTTRNQFNTLGYVLYGKAGYSQAAFDITTLDGQNGFEIKGTPFTPFSLYDINATSLQDMNGDGINDLAIGHNLDQVNGSRTGASYVVFGQTEEIFKDGFDD